MIQRKQNMITTLVLLPLIGVLLILILNRVYLSSQNEKTTIYMDVGIGASIITFLLSIVI
jgi:NADH:ubiquinone oxidoreductase subunit 4 (subunit M)